MIARNTTFIYEILKDSYRNRFIDDDSLRATSAVIDALIYIKEGQITIDDIMRVVRHTSLRGHLATGWWMYDESPLKVFESDNQIAFLRFIQQLEVLLLSVDSNDAPYLIKDAVKSKKGLIKKTIESTQKKYKTHGASQKMERQLHGFMTHDKFSELREELEIIEPN